MFSDVDAVFVDVVFNSHAFCFLRLIIFLMTSMNSLRTIIATTTATPTKLYLITGELYVAMKTNPAARNGMVQQGLFEKNGYILNILHNHEDNIFHKKSLRISATVTVHHTFL